MYRNGEATLAYWCESSIGVMECLLQGVCLYEQRMPQGETTNNEPVSEDEKSYQQRVKNAVEHRILGCSITGYKMAKFSG